MAMPKGLKVPQIAVTMREVHGDDYYHHLAKRGGSTKGIKKGFASMSKERLQEISALGGRRKHQIQKENKNDEENKKAGTVGQDDH